MVIVQKDVSNVARKVTFLESAQVKAVVIVHQEVTLVSNVAKKAIFPETAQALRLLLEVEEAEGAAIGQALEMSQQIMMASVTPHQEDGQLKKVLTSGKIQLMRSQLPLIGKSQKLLRSHQNGEMILS